MIDSYRRFLWPLLLHQNIKTTGLQRGWIKLNKLRMEMLCHTPAWSSTLFKKRPDEGHLKQEESIRIVPGRAQILFSF